MGGGRQDRKTVTCYQPWLSLMETKLAGLGSGYGPLIPNGYEKWQGGPLRTGATLEVFTKEKGVWVRARSKLL